MTGVPLSAVRALLAASGLPTEDVVHVGIDARTGVTVHVKARDEQGRVRRHGAGILLRAVRADLDRDR